MAEQSATNAAKKKKAFLIVGVVVAVGLAIGYFYTSYRETHVATDDAFIEGDIHTIAPRVGGSVRTVAVRDNQRVAAGDLLVELDPADHRSRVGAARANLALQQAQLRYAGSERNRAAALFKQDASSAERHDRAVANHEIAQAQVRLAEEQLRQAELNLGYTRVLAPSAGYVTRKSVQTGSQVKEGQPLMAVVDLDTIFVVANYKETELERIRPGQAVEISVDAYPGTVLKGTVDSIMAGTGVSFSLFPAENATGNYVKVVQRVPVKIALEPGADREHLLKVGMSVVPTVLAK